VASGAGLFRLKLTASSTLNAGKLACVDSSYNRIAGQNLERLAALSDGVFAVAMTLLVLDLRVPASEALRSEHDLTRALLALAPRLMMYLMSF
jgi:uncharacterized membrane protein